MDRIVLQPEFDKILKEKSTEPVWVQYKHCEEPAENGNLEFFQKDSKFHIDLEPSKKPTRFSINSISHDNKSVEIAYENEVSGKKAVRKFVAPMQKFALHWDPNNQAKQRPASWIDVSDGGLGVSCSLDGSILVWLADTGKIRRILDGHIGDVNFCKFFPSGLVVLSGAADMRLKVWSVEDGSSPVTLTGHCYGVSDAAIVERGRNVISVGRDGACKLYDVGEAKCLATVAKYECIINACAITSLDDEQMAALSVPPREEPPSDREILTENKLIACACEDGFLRVVSVRARKQMFEFDCGRSGVNCCCFLSPTKLACGTQNGHIFVFDLKNGTSNSWREFRSSILSMKPFGDGFIATTGDGSCFTCCPNEPGRTIDLTGPNCDPVYTVAFNQTHVFTCCRDGYIRKYSLEHLIR